MESLGSNSNSQIQFNFGDVSGFIESSTANGKFQNVKLMDDKFKEVERLVGYLYLGMLNSSCVELSDLVSGMGSGTMVFDLMERLKNRREREKSAAASSFIVRSPIFKDLPEDSKKSLSIICRLKSGKSDWVGFSADLSMRAILTKCKEEVILIKRAINEANGKGSRPVTADDILTFIANEYKVLIVLKMVGSSTKSKKQSLFFGDQGSFITDTYIKEQYEKGRLMYLLGSTENVDEVHKGLRIVEERLQYTICLPIAQTQEEELWRTFLENY